MALRDWLRGGRRPDVVDAPGADPAGADVRPAPAASPAGWRAVPPIQRMVAELPVVSPHTRLEPALASWRDPSFLAPLGHLIDPAGPAGRLHDAASVAPAEPVGGVPGEPPLAVPPRTAPGGRPRRPGSIATPAAPTPSPAPVVSRLLDVPGLPSIPHLPSVRDVPSVPDVPAAPAVPSMPSMTSVSDVLPEIAQSEVAQSEVAQSEVAGPVAAELPALPPAVLAEPSAGLLSELPTGLPSALPGLPAGLPELPAGLPDGLPVGLPHGLPGGRSGGLPAGPSGALPPALRGESAGGLAEASMAAVAPVLPARSPAVPHVPLPGAVRRPLAAIEPLAATQPLITAPPVHLPVRELPSVVPPAMTAAAPELSTVEEFVGSAAEPVIESALPTVRTPLGGGPSIGLGEPFTGPVFQRSTAPATPPAPVPPPAPPPPMPSGTRPVPPVPSRRLGLGAPLPPGVTRPDPPVPDAPPPPPAPTEPLALPASPASPALPAAPEVDAPILAAREFAADVTPDVPPPPAPVATQPAVQRLGGPPPAPALPVPVPATPPSAPRLAHRPELPGPVAAQGVPVEPPQLSTVEPPVVARLLGDRPVPERLPRSSGVGAGGARPEPAPAVPTGAVPAVGRAAPAFAAPALAAPAFPAPAFAAFAAPQPPPAELPVMREPVAVQREARISPAQPVHQQAAVTPMNAEPPAAPAIVGPPPPVDTAAEEPEELVSRLFNPLLRRLRAELRVERDRLGTVTDLRH